MIRNTLHGSQPAKIILKNIYYIPDMHPCHEIYRVEAVGLKTSNYTLKDKEIKNMWNLEQFREKSIFRNCLFKVRI